MVAIEVSGPSVGAVGVQTLTGQINVLMCGSVDDGKSTLIGRLLWDTASVPDDQREAIFQTGRGPDYSRLVDGLSAEREQGITIDIAWRFLDAGAKRVVIIDSPGHEQYTRNMASGASHADIAVLLVDARHGVKEQTRRHAALLSLFGIKRIVLAINKMDLVDWSEARFQEITSDFEAVSRFSKFDDVAVIPVSAAGGDNVVTESQNMAWFAGATLLGRLFSMSSGADTEPAPMRFPVQYVVRDGNDYRGLAGTLASGRLRVGDEFVDVASGKTGRVARIPTMDGDLESVEAGQAVTIIPDQDLDISRGAVLAPVTSLPEFSDRLDVRVVWLSEEPFSSSAGYLLRTMTDLVPVTMAQVSSLLDLGSLEAETGGTCEANDIAVMSIDLARKVAIDRFGDRLATGTFVLVDALTGATVAGGVVLATGQRSERDTAGAFKLTAELLQAGLCRDLDDSEFAKAELNRRANEVANILTAAGVSVDLSDIVGS